MAAAGLAIGRSLGLAPQAPEDRRARLVVDPVPLFELSPYLYMQFMEPLGSTDGSVEAAWDHTADRWRDDVLAVTRDLAPTMMRWGGIFVDFYRWREGVGPRNQRPSMVNLLWGGIESNQVGTMEFVDLCRASGAEPLICVNFESDGRRQYVKAKDKRKFKYEAGVLFDLFAGKNADLRVEQYSYEAAKPLVGRLLQRSAKCRATNARHCRSPGRPLLADRQRDVLRQERVRP